jgi:hypothetical protein
MRFGFFAVGGTAVAVAVIGAGVAGPEPRVPAPTSPASANPEQPASIGPTAALDGPRSAAAVTVVRRESNVRVYAPPVQGDPCMNEEGMNRWGYIDRPEPNPRRNFYFTRGAYSEDRGRGGSWSVDFPKADRQFLYVMERTLGWDVFPCENPISLDDENLRRFPFLYMLEVGDMSLSPRELENFRSYLLAGGFAYIDDFWDVNEWANFERQIRNVLPEYDIVDIPLDHMIFRIIYPIEEVLQIPNIDNGSTNNPAYYAECRRNDPCSATVRGIFNEDGRLMVVMTHNSDLGDAWEWAEQPSYPYERSNYAFSFAFNIIAYAMVY